VGSTDAAETLLRLIQTQPCDEVTLVVDALAIGYAQDLREALTAFNGRMVFTPHHGEMAMLTSLEEDAIAKSPEKVARDVTVQYGAVVVLKGSDTVIAAPNGTALH
jgi:ADP-dependent NAD(P)H-hydrate dehydratase